MHVGLTTVYITPCLESCLTTTLHSPLSIIFHVLQITTYSLVEPATDARVFVSYFITDPMVPALCTVCVIVYGRPSYTLALAIIRIPGCSCSVAYCSGGMEQ
jgi:hypothetical protein